MPGPVFPELARQMRGKGLLDACDFLRNQGYGYEDIAIILKMTGRRTEPKTVRSYLIPKSIRAEKRAA